MAARLMLLCLAFAVLPGRGLAQLADPTRPPAQAVTAAGAPATPAAASGLQSIILSRGQQRPAALINGEVVQLGGMVGESRLVQINEDHVVLLGASGERETLRLTPAVEKIEKVGAGKTAPVIGMNAVKGERTGKTGKKMGDNNQ